jgi:hypothetical protein
MYMYCLYRSSVKVGLVEAYELHAGKRDTIVDGSFCQAMSGAEQI